MELIKLERTVDFAMVLQNKEEPRLCHMMKAGEEATVFSTISKLTIRFVKPNFPESNAADVAEAFAIALMDKEPFWQILDVVNFFKYITQNADKEEFKIYGSSMKITPFQLMKYVGFYNERMGEELEKYHAARKERDTYSRGSTSVSSIKDLMGKEFEQAGMRNDKRDARKKNKNQL